MKKRHNMKKIESTLILFLFAALLCSCSKEERLPKDETLQGKFYTLKLNVTHNEFDSPVTKGESYNWPDGARLYIMFSNKAGTQEYAGTATYNKSAGTWTIPAPQGELHRGDSTACKVVYIDKAPEGDIIHLTTDDVIYEDINAKYLLGSETLTIRANLAPKTARVRLKGAAGSKVKLYGLLYYNKYNKEYNTYGTYEKELELTVQPDGYTPYVHVLFANEARKMEITDSNDKIYIYKCPNDIILAKESCCFDIPTTATLHGWKAYDRIRTYKVKDVEFKMIYAQHIDQSFYIAETETTQKLWCAIYGYNLSYHMDETLDLPAENMTLIEMDNFINNLSTYLGTRFSLPSYKQWYYAARGGIKSKEYKYSGSNNLDEVAWIAENSDNMTHPVKAKLPNELGLYDMTGNICEATYYTRSEYNAYGGDFGSKSSDDNVLLLNDGQISSTNHINDTYYNMYVGFRLCINL